MAYRCKNCGYKFKNSDSDLCPECFTAREDTNCTSYSDHSHGTNMSDYSDDSFIADQLKQEKKHTKEENSEAARDFIEGIKSTVSNQNTANRYGKQNSSGISHTSIKSNYNGGKSTLYHTSTYNVNSGNYSGGSSGSTPVDPKVIKKIVATFVIVFFIGPVISVVASIVSFVKNSNFNFSDLYSDTDISETDDYDYDYNYDYENTKIISSLKDYNDEDVSLKIKGTPQEIIFNSFESNYDYYDESTPYLYDSTLDDSSSWITAEFELVKTSSGESIEVNNVAVSVYGVDCNGVWVYSKYEDTSKFTLNTLTKYYDVYITYTDENDNTYTNYFEFNQEDFYDSGD